MRLERISFARRLAGYVEAINLPSQPVVEGRLLRMVGLTLEAEGLRAAIGSRCLVINSDSYHPVQVEAEVMGFSGGKIYLMPVGSLAGIAPGARVVPLPDTGRLPMGMSMLGRVLDGAGRALDGKGGMKAEDWVPMDGPAINPLKRDPISQPLDVGIRSINGLLTVGRGQRLGLFAGTGVGKSVLLGMMTRFTEAEIIVVGLIGERGREVKEFIDEILGEEGLKRSVVVASPADEAPLMRLRAAQYCTRIAEYFRDKGKNVLLLMDSLTRYAQAQREIALAIGEPPATKGYPPSVFAKLPKLVERAGNAEAGGGSITAFYTVLSEGDDQQGPHRRCCTWCARRALRPVPAPGRGRALSRYRYRVLDQPGHAAGGAARAAQAGAAFQAVVVALSTESRSDQCRCLCSGRRRGYRSGHRPSAGHGSVPASGPRRERVNGAEPRAAGWGVGTVTCCRRAGVTRQGDLAGCTRPTGRG